MEIASVESILTDNNDIDNAVDVCVCGILGLVKRGNSFKIGMGGQSKKQQQQKQNTNLSPSK